MVHPVISKHSNKLAILILYTLQIKKQKTKLRSTLDFTKKIVKLLLLGFQFPYF